MTVNRLFSRKHLLFAAFAVLFFAFLFPSAVRAEDNSGKVYLENIDVTGMNEEEVQAVIDRKMEQFRSDIIEVYVPDSAAYLPAEQLGLYYYNTDLAKTVASVGLNGNVLARYKMEDYIETNGAIFFALDLRFAADAVYAAVENQVAALNRSPVDMKLGRNGDGTFYTIPKIDGFHVLVDETAMGLTDYLCNAWHGGVGGFNAVYELEPAQEALGGDVAQMSSVLGSGDSLFSFDGDQASRAENIAVATAKINGTIVYPGEIFSAEQAMGPFTPENGYLAAAGYENGEVVDTVGGGICQVSSTLFRAVLEAELEVVERYQHSMTVGYVDPSMDATIAENSLDFKFRNTTDAPIYIEGITQNGRLLFTIYGHETRDPGRSIAFESEVTDYQESEIVLGLDPNMEYGTYDFQDGHDGLTAKAYKIVYQNGEMVSREQITSSYYVRSDGHLIVGTHNAPEQVLPMLQQAVANKDIGEMYVLSGYDVYGSTDGNVYGVDDAIALVNSNHGAGAENTGEAAAQEGQPAPEGEQPAPEGEPSAEAAPQEGEGAPEAVAEEAPAE